MSDELLTEEWLGEVAGFKWSQQERQPTKHWRLNVGWATDSRTMCMEDLGVEVCLSGFAGQDWWYCWLIRGPGWGNAVCVRRLRTISDLVAIIEAVTGQCWDPALSRYGNLYTAEQAKRFFADDALASAEAEVRP